MFAIVESTRPRVAIVIVITVKAMNIMKWDPVPSTLPLKHRSPFYHWCHNVKISPVSSGIAVLSS